MNGNSNSAIAVCVWWELSSLAIAENVRSNGICMCSGMVQCFWWGLLNRKKCDSEFWANWLNDILDYKKTKTNVSYLFFVNCNKRTSNLLFLIRCLTGVLCIPSGVYFAFCCFIEKQNKKWSYTQHTYKHFKWTELAKKELKK